MKTVKNTSMQGIYVTFETPQGAVQKFLAPKATTKVPDSWGGRVVENLLRRRMVKVMSDPVPPQPVTPPKKITRKSR